MKWRAYTVKVAVIKETMSDERRVALVPANIKALTKVGISVSVESGAGESAGFSDESYSEASASIHRNRKDLFQDAEIILTHHVNETVLPSLLGGLSYGQTIISMMNPLTCPESVQALAMAGINGIAMELIPRITRAQAMDVLSSNATIAGYKAVLIAASASHQLFPLMMTAAGTLKPARVFVMGVGVAGLQACATAKRLGAVVEAYDIRPAAQEQILAVGARPVQLDLKIETSESSNGYATEQSPEFIARQQDAMAEVLARQDIVITTAAIPGKKAPVLITENQLMTMKPGSVIVDLAAETGGNCALTELGRQIQVHNVTVIGPSNVAATVPNHASQMFGTNLTNLLCLMAKSGALEWNFDDPIIEQACVSYEGQVRNERVNRLLREIATQTPTTSVVAANESSPKTNLARS